MVSLGLLTLSKWGGILRSPSERADPLEREEASVTNVLAMADDVTKLPTGSGEQASLRQPPTVSDTTAAAFPRSTHAITAHTCGRRLEHDRSRRACL